MLKYILSLFVFSFYLTALASDVEHSGYIILLGNSGVGKSFLINLLLKNDGKPFASLDTPWSVTQTFGQQPSYLDGFKVADVPGIFSAEDWDKVVREIKKALLDSKDQYKLGFVLTPVGGDSGGRIDVDQLINIKTILKAIKDPLPYYVIVNRACKENREQWPISVNRLLSYQSDNITPVRLPEAYFFMPGLDKENIAENTSLFRDFVTAMKSGTITEVADIKSVDGPKIEELKKECEEEKWPTPAKPTPPLMPAKEVSCCGGCFAGFPWFF